MEGVEGLMRNLQLSEADKKGLRIGATGSSGVGEGWAGAGVWQGVVREDDPCGNGGTSIGESLVPDQGHRVQSYG